MSALSDDPNSTADDIYRAARSVDEADPLPDVSGLANEFLRAALAVERKRAEKAEAERDELRGERGRLLEALHRARTSANAECDHRRAIEAERDALRESINEVLGVVLRAAWTTPPAGAGDQP